MTVELTTLGNGLRVVSDTHAAPRDGVARALGRRRRAPRDRPRARHLAPARAHGLQGHASGAAPSDIAEEIEAVGGELNAATSLETTAYFARVLKGDDGVALEHPGRHPAELRASRADGARARARGDPAGDRRHPRQPRRHRLRAAARRGLSRTGRRPADSRHAVERRAASPPPICARSWSADYGAGNMVLSAAGAVDHDELSSATLKPYSAG